MAVSTVSALRDASHTTYICGKWVYTNSLEDGNYCIIEPTLPSNGDYSSYNLWGTFYLYIIHHDILSGINYY